VEKNIQYPDDKMLCENHVDALFISNNIPIKLSIGVGGDVDDDNMLLVSGKSEKFRMKEWYNGDRFSDDKWIALELGPNPREATMRAHLDHLNLLLLGEPNPLATIDDAFQVQVAVESLLN